MNFSVPADNIVKLKESEKKKYLDLARELKKETVEHEVTIIQIVIGALGTVIKDLVQGVDDLEITGGWRLSKLQHC